MLLKTLDQKSMSVVYVMLEHCKPTVDVRGFKEAGGAKVKNLFSSAVKDASLRSSMTVL